MEFVVDWFEKRCRLTPHHTAVMDDETGETWSYKQLEQRSLGLAVYLQQLGVEKGDRVALLSPNHIGYLDLLFACAKLGAIFVPLNWRLSLSEIQIILQDCQPKVITYHPSMNEISRGDHIFYLQTDGETYRKATSLEPNGLIKVTTVESTDPLMMIYTGGTTGRPKGVVLTHDSVFWNAINTIASWSLTAKDITVTILPMFHSGGINALTLPILHIGGTVVLAREFDAEKMAASLIQRKCTVVLMVPTMYHLLVQSAEFAKSSFPDMHAFISGGAPCPQTVYDAFAAKGLPFKEGYGLTEAGPNNFYIHPSNSLRKKGSVGIPMLYNEIKLIKEDGKEAKPNEVGEVRIRGKHLFQSYWNLPDITAKTLINGWLHTGDLGRKDEDGYFYIMGRNKDMIITGGENVYPLEVEHLLQQHPAIKEAAVIGIPDEKWGEAVTAVVALANGASLTDDEIKSYCAASIGKYKVPKHIIYVDELPKTHVGKIDKMNMIHKYSP